MTVSPPNPTQSRRAATAALACGLAVAAVTVAWRGAAAATRTSAGGAADSWWASWRALPMAAALAGCLLAAALSVPRGRVAVGLGLVVIGWLVPTWSAWGPLPDRLQVALLMLRPMLLLGIAVTVTGWARTLPPPRRHWLVALGAATLTAIALGLLTYDPFLDEHCSEICADVPALDGAIGIGAKGIAALLGVALVLAVVGLSVAPVDTPRLVRSAAALASALALPSTVRPFVGPTLEIGATGTPLLAGAAGLVGCAVLAVGIRTLRTRTAVERLVSGLEAYDADAPHGDLRPGLVQFALPDEDIWVDAAGRPAGSGESVERWLVLEDDHGPALRLALARDDDRDSALAALTPGRRLALNNARLAAVAHARLVSVRTSQRRIVAASDRERRRIERDLHDGAQQRLVSVAFHLSAARHGLSPELAKRLEPAEADVKTALAGLRHLARGVFPAALAHEGLAAALEDLASGADFVVSVVVVDPLGEIDLEVAMAVYAVAARSLALVRRDPLARVDVLVEPGGDTLRVVASVQPAVDDGAADLQDVRDRVGALGGSLSAHHTGPHRLELSAVIPCAS